MRYRFMLLGSLLFSLCFAAGTAVAQDTPNLVVNPGFEELDDAGKPVGWKTWLKQLPEPDCLAIDDTVAHSGQRSFRITHARSSSYSMMDQQVNFAPNKMYVVTGWIKGEKIKPGASSMLARLYIGKEGGGTFRVSRTFSGTFDWTFIEIGPFDVKERTWVSIIPYLHQASGTVWYDDLVLREVTEADMERRAQARARDRALDDLMIAQQTANHAGATDILPVIAELNQRLMDASDLPISLSAEHEPPYFGLHEEVFKLMARANRALWAKLKTIPNVYAHWQEPFSDVRPLHETAPESNGIPRMLEMLRGETETACARLTNLTEEPQTVTAQLSALKTRDGAELPADNLTWRLLKYVETRDGLILGDALPRIGKGADRLELSLPPGMTRDLWLMVDSTDVEAGQYEGRLEMTGAGGEKQDLLLSVLVYPVDFPAEIPMHTFAYAYTTWDLLKGRTEQSRADLVAHRINTYVIHGGFTPWPTFDENGEWRGLDWTKMDEQIALHAGCKFLLLWPGLEIGGRVDLLSPENGPKYPSAEWAKFAARWGKELGQGMQERGFDYNQWALYPVDEPSTTRAQMARAAGDAVHEGDPKIRIFENPYGAASDADMEHMGPAVDIWCPALSIAKDERLDFCRKSADEVWMYQVLAKTSHPLSSFRLAFWEAFIKDLRGFGFWDYADCGGSVWDAWDSDRHDYAVIYDGDDSELIPSKRWEAYREGAEDHAMLSMLRQMEGNEEARKLADTLPAEVFEAQDAGVLNKARQQIIRVIAGQ